MWSEKNQHTAYQCLNCGLVYIHPVPSDEELIKYYDAAYFTNYDPDEERRGKRYRQRLNQYKIDLKHILKYKSSGTVLDFGCGNGKYLEMFPSSFKKIGYEINPKAIEHLKKSSIGKFYTENIKCIQEKDIDLILMRGVIEHLPDPVSITELLCDKLKNGGYLFISATPNIDSPGAVLYKEKWNQFYFPDHLFYFSVRSLSFLLARFGLACIDAAFPYLETPYADLDTDIYHWLKDSKQYFSGKPVTSVKSTALVGNMLSVVFKKHKANSTELTIK